MFGAMQSGRIYRNEGRIELETSRLISPPQGDEEGLVKVSLQSVIHLIRQRRWRIPPPPTPPLASPPPPRFNMASTVKLHVFKGLGNEDPDQF